jgi:hypothetical protein
MKSLVESIRKKSPLTLYGVFLLILLATFLGSVGYCVSIILSAGPSTTHIPYSTNPSDAADVSRTIDVGEAHMKGVK